MERFDAKEFSGLVSKKRKHERPVLPPCRICGSKSSGYHYGVISCGACKAFFRRSIKLQTSYKCRGNAQCLIKPDQSVPCSYCRLQKCLDLGMSKEGSRMGRYTIQLRYAVITELNNIEEQVTREKGIAMQRQKEKEAELQPLADVVLEADINYPFASQEILNEVNTEQRKYKEMKNRKEELFGSLKPVPHNMYEHLFHNHGLELDDRREKTQICITETEKDILANINFAKALPGFRDLDIDDQLILLRDSQFEWLFFSFLPLINTEEKLMTCPSCGYTFTIDEAQVIHDDGFDVNSFRCAEIISPLALTMEEIALVKAMCIFNPDGCLWPPKDPEKIGEIQQKYLDALQFLLEKNGRDTAKVLGRIIYCMTVMKTCLHWHSRRSENWTTIFPGVKCPELVQEWLRPNDYNCIPDFKRTRLILLEETSPTPARLNLDHYMEAEQSVAIAGINDFCNYTVPE